ncbi:bb3-type cytochrome oxidase subunit III [Rugamonas sp. DEMB1]|uniref:bb3-type cytochrome oxidase subunit III n=1 Tax=Rugamonas sp. DEMB1 TaxID=3039386 RepID=UPI00244955D3|nr:bb3-type cytochrome oxidase subunit III [Rugamonas sp. DEMB1]WGG48209.1 bb3-type cytochrome oxidase subunit III [Rugamonas sp. DEMB1]
MSAGPSRPRAADAAGASARPPAAPASVSTRPAPSAAVQPATPASRTVPAEPAAAAPPVASSSAPAPAPSAASAAAPPAVAALWLLMGVLSMLFLLFGAAYLMRMSLPDWRPLPFVPWQLWLSSALLAASGAGWEASRRRAARPAGGAAGAALAAACLAALAFLAAQLWAWQRMSALNFPLAGNPANSFFYLLTGLHGLHVAGGLLVGAGACLVSLRGAGGVGGAGARAAAALRLRLCARYWHFLLVWWLLLFGLLFLLTPELARAICGTA